MKKNITAALLSGLVLPGAGQLYRGRKLKGGIMLLLVTILLLFLVTVLASTVQECMEATRLHGELDETLLAEVLRRRAPAALWLSGAFFSLWVFGVVDALLDRGNGKDTAEKGSPPENGNGSPPVA